MRSRNKNAAYFDDDFEVTYEDEMSFQYDTGDKDFETQEMHSAKRTSGQRARRFSDTEEIYQRNAGRDRNRNASRYDRRYNTDNYDTDDYDIGYDADRRNERHTDRRRAYRPTQLAAPIRKGGNAVLNIARTLIRNLTLFLMLAILILMGYNFLRGSTPYGDIENAVASNTYTMTLAAYFSVVALLMFYEIISMLWAMTRVRVHDEYGTYREDVGRGMFSFIFLYLCSFASFYISDWIPESIEILKGLRGVLDVFGSMHNTLFGFCLAGVISCLFRKYSISL